MTRAIPWQAVDLVKRFEGFKAEAYLCPAKVWTIGYGHTLAVRAGQHCTQRQADLWLTEDLTVAAKRIERLIGAEVIAALTAYQWGALLSFVFNLGATPTWTLWKLLRARDFDAVPPQLLRFVYAGKKKLAGLVNRRIAEVEMWHKGDPKAHKDEDCSAELRVVDTPPQTSEKPLAQSKTIWTGAAVAAGGVIEGAKQVQALAAPQAMNSELVARIAAFVAVLIVAGGIAIMAFRWLDARARRS